VAQQAYGVFAKGLFTRYTYQTWDPDRKVWSDAAGSNRTGVAQGAKIGFSRSCDVGNGATAPVCSVQGTAQAILAFGAGSVPAGNFTICSVSRFAGATQNQIINSKSGGFIHGHFKGRLAAATYADSVWLTANSDVCPSDVNCIPQITNTTTDWLVFCGQNNAPNKVHSSVLIHNILHPIYT
jgi:hypothetical protein